MEERANHAIAIIVRQRKLKEIRPQMPRKPALLLPLLNLMCLIRSVNIVVVQDFRVPVQRKTVSHFLFLELILL